ncbi:cobalamin biosynthesis protein CbiX [Paenibacillus darwinianus]|uniref:Cobalamin biosynthesis protein CbiX n=1 Tax=Paenibacillus darwinianus TaxID=1380763 RepID=A0A9W5RZC8_9BACL|nr:CbiX/SirB N-terminal domain-containing protein [Paenibacillus darwinianus]EXX85711.1 cobalamin biosynthesis protein CbiX [Paenibacillus darwinianus]EXX87025.1 cobalamin biosynthesis protein CbiX [Paenibacillus darwinianus]EXX88942.1 cobalamin biosynthesis protein CbiX [Paenibacillus darwinianus]
MKPGVLVISHGSRDPDWVALVDEAVDAVRRPADLPVVSSFLEIVEGRLIQDGINALEADGVTHIYVLPLFVSSGSTHVDDIGQAFGRAPAAYREGEMEPFAVKRAAVAFGKPIDDDPVIAEIVYGNVRELSVEPERETLLLVAHGSREKGLNRVWRTGMSRLAERVRVLGGFKRAEIATLLPDQAACVMKALTGRRADAAAAVLVAPLFLSRGYFTSKVIPGRLEGFDYRYNGHALLPNRCISRWMERQIGEWLTELEAGGLGIDGDFGYDESNRSS